MPSSGSNDSTVKVLGIDPGLDRTGWAVVEKSAGADPSLISSGLIHTSAESPLADRLDQLYTELEGILRLHRPATAAIEKMFFVKRAATVGATVQARGVILLCLKRCGTQVREYDPRTVKSQLSGNGNADKAQMQRMVQAVFKLPKPPSPDDVADAMAIALCQIKIGPVNDRMQAALAMIKRTARK